MMVKKVTRSQALWKPRNKSTIMAALMIYKANAGFNTRTIAATIRTLYVTIGNATYHNQSFKGG